MKQTTEHTNHGLPIEEDIQLAETAWVVQRIGWVLIVLFVIAAAAGMFGNGVLSEVRLSKGGYEIRYERFGRYQMPQQVTIHARAIDGHVRILIQQPFAEHYDIEMVTPQPNREQFEKDNILLEFNADTDITLVFTFEPQESGSIEVPIKVNEQAFTISQFIYP